MVIRDRKLDITALVWSLVFGFAIGDDCAVEELRRTYIRLAGHYLCSSSFHDRLTASLANLLRGTVQF